MAMIAGPSDTNNESTYVILTLPTTGHQPSSSSNQSIHAHENLSFDATVPDGVGNHQNTLRDPESRVENLHGNNVVSSSGEPPVYAYESLETMNNIYE